MKITVHTLIKNEARFVWYAVMSVYDYVDKILIWDTGSTDETFGIIKEIINSDRINKKVIFRQFGSVTPETFANARQDMLNKTDTDWFIVLDGDEIWWDASIANVTGLMRKHQGAESIVVPTINLIGDMFHYQEAAAGQYKFAGRKGHFNLRAINRNIPGLASSGTHGVWGWVDGEGKMIQDRNPKKIVFVDSPYLHATNLPRATHLGREKDVPKRVKKLKYEIGTEFAADFYYPEVFFHQRPEIVPSVWFKTTKAYFTRALVETPLKKIKRRIFESKFGY